MNIAVITTQFFPYVGGAEMVVHHLARQWHLQGHTVCVMNHTSGRPASPDIGYAVRRYGILRGMTRFGAHRFPFHWYTTRHLERLLHIFRPDFISAHYGYPTAMWLSRLRPLPRFVVTCHGEDLNPSERPRRVLNIDRPMAAALNSAHRVIAISSCARRLMEDIGVAQDRIADIPNGVDLQQFQSAPAADIRGKHGIPQDAPLILSVGRNHPSKDRQAGLRAFAALRSRMPGAFYLILGPGNELYLPLARELGIERSTAFGRLYGPELIAAYRQADVFFSSSIAELCSVALLEALAAGLPVVATGVGGSPDVITPGENGFLVPPADHAAMATALHDLIDSRELHSRIAQANRIKARMFDWDLISRRYLALQ